MDKFVVRKEKDVAAEVAQFLLQRKVLKRDIYRTTVGDGSMKMWSTFHKDTGCPLLHPSLQTFNFVLMRHQLCTLPPAQKHWLLPHKGWGPVKTDK